MSVSRQERKVVTALFCDLVGFTSQAEEMDPEDVASLLAPYHARVKEELERYGGTVEKFIGDAVMALFGAPVTHEDDPERAIRAALAIRGFADEEGLELRVGIATGEALVALDARPDAGETMATGDVVNTAARLQSAAPVNGILVSERTFQAARAAIDFRETAPIEAKGKARPVAVWEVVAARGETDTTRPHGTRLVGRARELDLLAGVVERTCAERHPQLVTLVGVPGIGKSRLVHELSTGREGGGLRWVHGRCLPYGDGLTFWALGEIVRALLDVDESDSPAVVETKLAGASLDEWVATELRPLVGLEDSDIGVGLAEAAHAAWRSFLETAAADVPLAVVFEDLHWADEDLLDFVDYLVEWASGVGLLVVCTARPELLERRPTWGGGKTNSTIISLAALTDAETATLVGDLLGQRVMDAGVQQALLVRAAGNPLYAEEFARLIEDDDEATEVPETVQGLIAARLDVLAPQQKALLQDAAVIGGTFSLDAVRAVAGVDARELEVAVHVLERRGFVRRERSAVPSAPVEYTFHHVLTADVAYAQIPRPARSTKHRLVAEWLSAGPSDETVELRAYHYGEALALARAARLETTDFEEPARHAFRDAAARALEQGAFRPAVRLYEDALDLWPTDDHGRAELLLGRARAVHSSADESRYELFDGAREALLATGDAENAALAQSLGALSLRNAGRGIDALQRARGAVELVTGLPESTTKTYVQANCARLLTVLAAEHEEALAMARDALVAARSQSRPDLEAHCLNTIGVARVALGDVEGVADAEESLRIGLEHCSPFENLRIYNNLDSAYFTAGRVAESDAVSRAALEMAARWGLPTDEREAIVASSDFASGRWQEALDRLAALRERGARMDRIADYAEMQMLFGRDDVVGAITICERALESTRSEQLDPDVLAELQFLLGYRARLARAEGQEDVARELVDELLEIEIDSAHMFPLALVWLTLLLVDVGRYEQAAALQRSGQGVRRWDEVATAIAAGRIFEAADELDGMGAPTFAAEARLVGLRRAAAEGAHAGVEEPLGKALAFYRSVGATRHVREAEALLLRVA